MKEIIPEQIEEMQVQSNNGNNDSSYREFLNVLLKSKGEGLQAAFQDSPETEDIFTKKLEKFIESVPSSMECKVSNDVSDFLSSTLFSSVLNWTAFYQLHKIPHIAGQKKDLESTEENPLSIKFSESLEDLVRENLKKAELASEKLLIRADWAWTGVPYFRVISASLKKFEPGSSIYCKVTGNLIVSNYYLVTVETRKTEEVIQGLLPVSLASSPKPADAHLKSMIFLSMLHNQFTDYLDACLKPWAAGKIALETQTKVNTEEYIQLLLIKDDIFFENIANCCLIALCVKNLLE
jgi:hypothetical protein